MVSPSAPATDPREVVIDVRGIVTRFGRQVVHDGLDLQVRRGDLAGIGFLSLDLRHHAHPCAGIAGAAVVHLHKLAGLHGRQWLRWPCTQGGGSMG